MLDQLRLFGRPCACLIMSEQRPNILWICMTSSATTRFVPLAIPTSTRRASTNWLVRLRSPAYDSPLAHLRVPTGRYPRTTVSPEWLSDATNRPSRLFADAGYMRLKPETALATCANGVVETRIDDEEGCFIGHTIPNLIGRNAYTQWLH